MVRWRLGPGEVPVGEAALFLVSADDIVVLALRDGRGKRIGCEK